MESSCWPVAEMAESEFVNSSNLRAFRGYSVIYTVEDAMPGDTQPVNLVATPFGPCPS
jgi:hypothetical protein